MALTFESVDEILWCYHSNERYCEVLSCGTVNYDVQGGSNFWICGWNPMVWPFKCRKATEQYFPVVLLIMSYKVVLTSDSVDEILRCEHQDSNESYWAVLSCGTVNYVVQGCLELPILWMQSYGVTIQTKATEQYFNFLWYCLLCCTRWF